MLSLPALVQGSVSVHVGQVSAYPGHVVDLPVTLATDGVRPSSLAFTLFFPDPRNVTVQQRGDGKPDCTPEASILTPSHFVFWPVGCIYDQDECDAVHVLFIDLSGANPNIPDGPLFVCQVRVSTGAAPGSYAVRNIDVESAGRGGVELAATGIDGGVTVLEPPGGGGCSVALRSSPKDSALLWLSLPLILALGRPFRHKAQPLRALCVITVGVCAFATAYSRAAIAGVTELTAEGECIAGGQRGTLVGDFAVGTNGSVSGSVTLPGIASLDHANVLAVWSRGRIREGSLFGGNGARIGRLRGALHTGGIAGDLVLNDGTVVSCILHSVRSKKKGKVAAPQAMARLADGRGAQVVVVLDSYSAIRAARQRVQDLANRYWDTPPARETFFQVLRAHREALVAQLRADADVTVLSESRRFGSVTLHVKSLAALQRLLEHEHIRSVEDLPSFSLSLRQSLPRIGQPTALGRGFSGRNVVIGVVDSGVDWLLRDAATGQLVFGEGCLNGTDSPGCAVASSVEHACDVTDGTDQDPRRRDNPWPHGTVVSGIAWSVAPESRLVVSDVYDECAELRGDQPIQYPNWERALEWLIDMVEWRVYPGLKVVNFSLGGLPGVWVPNVPPAYCDAGLIHEELLALQYLDLVLVAATGNSGRTNWVDIPACVRRVVRVAATYDQSISGTFNWWGVCQDVNPRSDQVACFSNTWSLPLLAAPGAFVEFASRNFGGGTSWAAPHVAGAVAALRGEGPYSGDAAECIVARLSKTGVQVFRQYAEGLFHAFPRVDLDAATRTYPNSVGNCNGDRWVSASELERGIAIGLGLEPVSACPAFDPSGDGETTIDELVAAVNVHLFRCAVGESGYV